MRIVVPLDRSAFGETAIPHALGLADGGTIALVTAIDPMLEPVGGIPELETMLLTASTKYLEEIAEAMPSNVTVETHVLGRPVTSAIATFVEEFNADLVVMSTHGRGPISRFWLGSVADRLTRTSPVPLYLVRPDGETDVRPQFATPVPAPEKVLVPVDGSEFGEAAIEATGLLGPSGQQTLHLLRVSNYPHFLGSVYMPETIAANREIAGELLATAEKYIEGLATELRNEGREVLTNVVSAEFTAPAILEYGESWGADVIALSTHGRSGFTRMALGSVADKVVRQSSVPVLLIRAEDS